MMIFINEPQQQKTPLLLTLESFTYSKPKIQGLAYQKEDMLLLQTIIIQEINYS
jgi:hypothetical protein